ncbi:prohibitin family protein, partial [Bacillus sp. SS-TM]
MSVKVIDQGHAGVVYNRSTGIEKETLGQGWHLVSPFKRVTAYPISTETVKVDKFSVQTKDGKPLTVSLSYDYMNDAEKLPKIYNKFKGQAPDVIENGWLQTRLKKATLNVFSNYSVLEVFQHQGEINGAIEKEFRKMVDTTGFLVDSVTLEAPKPDANTAKAIQGVVDAQQNLEKAEIEKKQATINAEKAIEEARGKAEANEIIKKSLT